MATHPTVFWRPSKQDRTRIERTGRIQDTEDGLSEFSHVIVNQARLQQFLLDYMRMSPTRLEANYGLEFVTLKVEPEGEHPVVVTLRDVGKGSQTTVRAKYVVGCDGARSAARESIGAVPEGDFANHAWGVVDMLAVTDFPDIRLKAAIQSSDEGNIPLIPREGGYMVRLCVDLGEINPTQREAFRDKHTQESVIATAQRVLRSYTLDVKRVVWFAVYQVGQRVTDRFDDVPAEQAGSRLPRVFIAGDACHTHSAKAGQGMNVSMQDTFNLGWKLASVLEERARPALLRTYSAERHAIAQGLIDFDKEWSKIMAWAPKDPSRPELGGVDPQELQAYFVKSGRYTAGVATHYAPTTVLTAEATHQHLAKGFMIGTRFHSAPVVRLADAKPMHLGHAAALTALGASTPLRMRAACNCASSQTFWRRRQIRRSVALPRRCLDPRGRAQDSAGNRNGEHRTLGLVPHPDRRRGGRDHRVCPVGRDRGRAQAPGRRGHLRGSRVGGFRRRHCA